VDYMKNKQAAIKSIPGEPQKNKSRKRKKIIIIKTKKRRERRHRNVLYSLDSML
jgi:hypothetical protein